MLRLVRLDAPGALHHVMGRGVERKPILLNNVDRNDFINRLSDLVKEGAIDIYAWALMPNHFHFKCYLLSLRGVNMKIMHRIKFFVFLTVVLMAVGITENAVASKNKDCWNLVAVKAEWKKLNSDGHYVAASPNGIKFHFSTDGSWQWVEYDDPRNPRNRIFARAGWSSPPKQFCYPSEIGISLKLDNKAINNKNKNTAAILTWGPDNIYGNGRRQIRIGGHEAGASKSNKVRMHNGQMSLDKPATWNARVEIGGMSGKINYHYLPMTGKIQSSQSGRKTLAGSSQKGHKRVALLNGSDDAFVRSLYYAILDRQPDEGGVKTWKHWLSKGHSREWVINQFFRSQEYLSRNKNNTEYVRDLYQGVLGRQPDSGGLAHWVNRLNRGSSRQSVLNGFLNSREYRTNKSKG